MVVAAVESVYAAKLWGALSLLTKLMVTSAKAGTVIILGLKAKPWAVKSIVIVWLEDVVEADVAAGVMVAIVAEVEDAGVVDGRAELEHPATRINANAAIKIKYFPKFKKCFIIISSN
jgi:hypothetical protein